MLKGIWIFITCITLCNYLRENCIHFEITLYLLEEKVLPVPSFHETKPRQCVVFQLGFGIDIGLSLQWSKQMGRYVD